MFTLLRRIVETGTEGLPDRTQNQVLAVNTICLTAFTMTLVNCSMFTIAGWYFVALVNFAFALLYPGLITINGCQKQRLAKVGLAFAVIVHLSSMTLLFGSPLGLHFYLISVPILSLLVFDKKEIWIFLIVAIVSAISFAYLNFFFLTSYFPVSGSIGILRNLSLTNSVLAVVLICIVVFVFYNELQKARDRLEFEHSRSEALLLNILPKSIASRLKDSHKEIADRFGQTSILFADFVGFTPFSESLPPEELVHLLNRYFTEFDDLTEKHGVEKIKTIGDAYMVAAGIPNPKDGHATALAEMAIDMIDAVKSVNESVGKQLQMRIGIDSGPAVAGVIGRKKYSYDLWGDTVNTASRMESHGVPDGIHVTQRTYNHLKEEYRFTPRSGVEVKGKGTMETYLLLGRRENRE